jgi:aldose 1-epimerase
MKLTQYLAAILVPFSMSVGTVAGDFQIFDEVMPGNSVDENLNMKVLKNDVTGEYVKIIHDFGGRLEDLTLVSKSRNKLKQVLATHDNNASAVRANVHWAGAMLAPFANRIANGTYTFEGNTYYLPRNEVRCNGKCDCALHGFLWNKAMHIAGTITSGTSAKLILQYEFDGTDPGYPFVLNMTLTYELSATGLDIHVHAKNPSKTLALPFFHSVHPYFVAEDVSKCIVEFDNCTSWNHMDMGPGAPVDGALIPTGKASAWQNFDGIKTLGGNQTHPTYYDDEFKAILPVSMCNGITNRIHDPISKDTAVLHTDSNFRVFQIFTGGMTKFDPPLSAIAMEPMSALADAFNNGDHLSVLSAGEVYQASFGIGLEAYIKS